MSPFNIGGQGAVGGHSPVEDFLGVTLPLDEPSGALTGPCQSCENQRQNPIRGGGVLVSVPFLDDTCSFLDTGCNE